MTTFKGQPPVYLRPTKLGHPPSYNPRLIQREKVPDYTYQLSTVRVYPSVPAYEEPSRGLRAKRPGPNFRRHTHT